MSVVVNLSQGLVRLARSYASVGNCSVSKQIEHWARIGRLVEENSDINYNIIKKILFGLEEMQFGNVQTYDPNAL